MGRARRNQHNLEKLYSLLIVIRKINKALLTVKSEPELFQQICDLLVELDDIRFVWIGLAQPGGHDVKVAAKAGVEEGYLSSFKVSCDDAESGKGPTATAMKTLRPFIANDIGNGSSDEPWKVNARSRDILYDRKVADCCLKLFAEKRIEW